MLFPGFAISLEIISRFCFFDGPQLEPKLVESYVLWD